MSIAAYALKAASFVLQGTVVAIGFLAVMWFVGSLVDSVAVIKERDSRSERFQQCLTDTAGDRKGCEYYR